MSIEEINDTLSKQLPVIKPNVKILTPKDVGFNYLLRIDTEKKTGKKFFPRIANTQADSEDRTLPRIVGSPYILGCIIAVPSINPNYRFQITNGFYIHELAFEYCLQPSKKLVFDADSTNELWLITYNKDTVKYTSKLSGELLVKEYIITPYSEDKKNVYQKCRITVLVNVIKKDGLWFNKKIKLEQGYYSVTFNIEETKNDYSVTTLDSDYKNVVISTILEVDFNKCKKSQTSLEDLDLTSNSSKTKLSTW